MNNAKMNTRQLIFSEYIDRKLQEYTIARSCVVMGEILVELQNVRTGKFCRMFQSELRELCVSYKSVSDCLRISFVRS